MKKETIIAGNKNHLMQIIRNEIELSGHNCNLNHINVSN